MATATPIPAADLRGHPGADTALYRLDPPMAGHVHIIVWTEDAQPHLPARAVAVAADEHGAVVGTSMKPVVEYTHPWKPTHSGLLWLAGMYEIGEPDSTPEPETVLEDDVAPEEAS